MPQSIHCANAVLHGCLPDMDSSHPATAFRCKVRGYQTTAWCNEIGSLTSLMHVTQVHPVTTENQLHCTRLYFRKSSHCVQKRWSTFWILIESPTWSFFLFEHFCLPTGAMLFASVGNRRSSVDTAGQLTTSSSAGLVLECVADMADARPTAHASMRPFSFCVVGFFFLSFEGCDDNHSGRWLTRIFKRSGENDVLNKVHAIQNAVFLSPWRSILRQDPP